jgi:hypothetical protein
MKMDWVFKKIVAKVNVVKMEKGILSLLAT